MADDGIADSTVDFGRGMGPGSRSLRSLGRGHELLFSFLKQQRIPGRGNRRLPRSGVHAGREAVVRLPLTDPPQATSHGARARFITRTTHYKLRTTYRLLGPCQAISQGFVAVDGPTTCHELRATGQPSYHVPRTTYYAPCTTLTAPAGAGRAGRRGRSGRWADRSAFA